MESRLTRDALVALALLQALALYSLGLAIEEGTWPATSAPALLSGYLLAVGVPVFIYLCPLRAGEWRYDLAAAALVAIVLLVMGWHTGAVLAPAPDGVNGPMRRGAITQVFAPDLLLSAVLIVFITSLLFRAWRDSPGEGLPWRCQLEAAWGNALTLALVLAFVLLLWALLFIWGALFSLIGIDFFRDLFRERAFRYAATGLAGGVGLMLVRSRIGLVTAVRSICEALARVLAPLAAVIVFAFALTLPFTGIDLLWQDGRRPTALLWLAAFMLFLANAALGEDGFSGRMRRLQWLVGIAVVLLLPLLAVAFVGLLQRVAVFGWSGARLWAVIVTVMLMAYAVAMGWSLLRHRALVPETIGRWNTALALVLVAVLAAVHSPVADLRRVVATDQLARVLDGRTPTVQFDAAYMHRSLGRYGRDMLERLRASELAEDAQFLARLDRAEPGWYGTPEPLDAAPALARLLQSTTVDELPPDLLSALARDRDAGLLSNCRDALTCYAERVEFEGQIYWMVLGTMAQTGVRGNTQHYLGVSRILRERDGEWQSVGSIHPGGCETTRGERMVPPVLHRLPDLPGVMLEIGECRYSIVWLVVPESLD